MKETNLIGVVGDLHLKDELSYSEYVADKRVPEKKEILDFIVKTFKDCEHIVFLGDNFNSKNNSSETNREMVEFLERFKDKNIYMLAGNHEKKGDGKTAIDFLGEIKKPNWHIFTKPSRVILGEKLFVFLPNMLKSELGVETNEEANPKIMSEIGKGDILFAHHSVTGTTFQGIKTDSLNEIVLPKKELEKNFELIVAGHIHAPQQYGKVLITGSVFTKEVNEVERFIYKIKEDLSLEKFKVPAREIHKLENPTLKQITELPKNSILKMIITDKKIDIEELKVVASGLDAYLLVEDYPSERKKIKIEEGAMDFSIEALLKLYASEKGVSEEKLLKALSLIN